MHDMSSIVKSLDRHFGATGRDRLGRLFGGVLRRWRRHVDEVFREEGFTEGTRAPLILLYDLDEPVRQKHLADELGLDPTALVRVIGVLSRRGMVECIADPADRRGKLISLTQAGRECAQRLIGQIVEIERRLFSDVTDDELAVVRTVFAKVMARLASG